MALTAVELKMLLKLLRLVRKDRPRVLMLGYPDLLVTEDAAKLAGLDLDWNALEKSENCGGIWRDHGRERLIDRPMLDTKSLFASMGADVTITEIGWMPPWRRDGVIDFQLDLNHPMSGSLRKKLGTFDLIIDPGTLEHCFNIAQAFVTIHELLAYDGFVYHQDAAAFPNHGFWSISPTAFFDWYHLRGYQIGKAFYINRSADADGLVPHLVECDPYAPPPSGAPNPLIGLYTFRKRFRLVRSRLRGLREFPIQRIYAGGTSNPPKFDLADFYG